MRTARASGESDASGQATWCQPDFRQSHRHVTIHVALLREEVNDQYQSLETVRPSLCTMLYILSGRCMLQTGSLNNRLILDFQGGPPNLYINLLLSYEGRL